MKKLLILAAFAGFASQISAEYKISAIAKAVKETAKGNPTHYCMCDNNTLESINGHEQCIKTGYYDKYELTPDGVRFFCGQKGDNPVEDKNTEDASCKSKIPSRCWWSGFNTEGKESQGWIYSVKEGDFEKVPTQQEYDRTHAKRK